MVNEEKTKAKFGYTSDTLCKYSTKIIIVQCDYCDKEIEKGKGDRTKSNDIIDKDCCWDCRFKKREEISLKKYGVRNCNQRQEVRNKIRSSNIDRLQSQEWKDKLKGILVEKYGVDNVFKSQEIRDKAKATIKKRYGVDNVFQDLEIRERAKQTILKKYGVDNVTKHKDIQNKILNTRLNLGQIDTFQGKRRSEWAKEIGFSRSKFDVLVHKYGFEQAIKMEPHISCLEKIVSDYLDSINIKYERHIRVDNKVADLLITDKKIILEIDGLYWHSEHFLDRSYHIKKRELYIKNGYIPLFFRQHEINDDKLFDIVKSVINHKLGLDTKFYARKCVFIKVLPSIGKAFFNNNHLMGCGAGEVFGLLHNDELVSAIQVKKTKDGYEISRFCNTLNTSVVGGFSKLISHIPQYRPLTTFIDLRYGAGTYLSSLGFSFSATHPSFKWTDGHNLYNRMKFPGNSGYEQGLFRIWDCGQAKWVL